MHRGGVLRLCALLASFTLLLTVLAEGAHAQAITGFTPTEGPVGTEVTITGSDFSLATDVHFNGTPASFIVDSDTQIRATVPEGATTGPISVVTPDGTATSDDPFTVTKPNILIIVTDDQREGLEVMPKTIKWFGDGGTEYTNAFVTTPLCCPSRSSIFTGQYAHNHGVKRSVRGSALDQTTTIQYYLHQAGYRTGLYGKYLNGWHVADNSPYFDKWAFYTCACKRAYSGGTWNVQGVVQTVSQYATLFIGDQAVSFIDSSTQVPWFLYLATPNPHPPMVAEPKYEHAPIPPWAGDPAVFETDRSDKPPYIQQRHATFRNGKINRREQLETLLSVDDMVDRVMQALSDRGQLDNTLAFFISDNGKLWAEHGWGDKRVPYTQSIQVPMLASWPGRIAAGAQDTRMVANIDIAPTVLEAAGITPHHTIDGHSLLSSYARARILTEYWHEGRGKPPTWASIRTKTGQYVEYHDSGVVTFTEFYDLVQDPWQLENLSVPPPGWPEQLAADQTCAGVACP